MQGEKFKTVDQYIATFPESTQALLKQFREILRKAAPQGQEVISYNMPAIKMHKPVAYYAGYKAHLGFYPMPDAIKAFETELQGYKLSKGTVQFPLDKSFDEDLIMRMVKFNIEKDEERAREKARK